MKGNFLNRDEVKVHYKYFYSFFPCYDYDLQQSLGQQKKETVNQLKEQAEEYNLEMLYAQSRLIKVRMESELSKEMEGDSLMSLENHPHKL